MPKAPVTNRGRECPEPESEIREALRTFMQARGWLVEITHGNKFQTGFPDLFCYHPRWSYRWIDCKRANRYSFTKAQKQKWPVWDRFGVGIWILVSATQNEYDKLFGPPNWRDYWKPSWKTLTESDIDKLLEGLSDDCV